MKQKKWSEVMALRGEHFAQTWNNFCDLMSNSDVNSDQSSTGPSWAVAHIGCSVPGMNAILYAVVRYAYAKNIRVLAAKNGLKGLQTGQFEQMQWQSVSGITAVSRSMLGSFGLNSTESPEEMIQAIKNTLAHNQVQCLCLVGDHTAFQLAKLLQVNKVQLKVCYIPASLKPKENLSAHCKLGFDSVLNESCQLLSKLCNQESHNSLHLVKLNLALLFALANSAAFCYPSSKALIGSAQIDETQVEQDANNLKKRLLATGQNQIVLVYVLYNKIKFKNCIYICFHRHDSLFSQVVDKYRAVFGSQRQLTTNLVDLCPVQVPMEATPFDRKLGVKLGMRCAQYFADVSTTTGQVLLSAPTIQLLPF